jgi:glucose/arabinose dehydrogenase
MKEKTHSPMQAECMGRRDHFLLVLIISFCFVQWSCNKMESLPSRSADQLKGQTQAVDLQLIADGVVSPLGVVEAPDESDRLFIIDQIGKVWIVNSMGTKLAIPFIDVSPMMISLRASYDERGLLGLAFHPDFGSNGKFYIYYQLPPNAGGPAPGVNWDNLSRVSEFTVSAGNPDMADMASEKVVIEWDDPQFNHNGGTLAFGPDDGYLYISLGDGGGANDVAPGHVEDWYAFNAGGNAQNIEANLFGSILRIDVNSAGPYNIPASNPLVGKAGRDEIWAYGFRNPYRFSFDMGGSHQLFAGDAGQVLYEEVDVVTKGGNYGWNVKEGTACFTATDNKVEAADCPDVDAYGNPLTDPVIQLNNWQNPKGGIATTVIGGNVYRGDAIPGFKGKYIFGTFSQTPTTANGELFIANIDNTSSLWPYREVRLKDHPDDVGYYLKGFGQDDEGEIYLTVSSLLGPQGNAGKVFKLVPAKD